MEAVRTILTGDCAMPWVHCDKTGVLKGFVVCGGLVFESLDGPSFSGVNLGAEFAAKHT